jgi:hypothetical protein
VIPTPRSSRPESDAAQLRRRLAYLAPFLLVGCAGYRALELPVEPAHGKSNYQEKLSLTAAARVLVDPASIAHHFGPEFAAGGFFPVIVDLENRGENSFEIERKDFKVLLENGEVFLPVAPLELYGEIRRSRVSLPVVLLAPFIVPSFFLIEHTDKYNFELAADLGRKSFPKSIRLERGDPPLTRALFFRDPRTGERGLADFESSVLQFVVESEGSRPTENSSDTAPKVGKAIAFTISLAGEDTP